MTGPLLTALTLAIAFYLWRQTRPFERTQPRQALLRRSLNPRHHVDLSPVWRLTKDPQCRRATHLSSGLLAAADAENLEAYGCGPGHCRCHYTPVSDRRRRPRRLASDRREQIRFAADPDRRHDDRRQQDRLWSFPGCQR